VTLMICEFNDMYSSHDISWFIKPGRMILLGGTSRAEEKYSTLFWLEDVKGRDAWK
jgi:hypothetical protein